MAKNSDLFDLIHSLSKSEKRYFKRFSMLNGRADESKYIRLFDFIADQDEYDEEKILEKFRGDYIAEYFSETKYYLHNAILKSLHYFHLEDSLESRLQMLIHQAEILYSKKLYSQFEKNLDKAYELALRNDKLLFLIDILSVRYRTLLLENKGSRLNKAEKLFDEIISHEEKLGRHLTIWRLHVKMFFLMKASGFPRTQQHFDKYAEIMTHPLMLASQENFTESSKIYFHLNNALFKEINGDYDGAIGHYKEILQLVTKEKYMQTILQYAPMLYNICLMCIRSKDTEKFFLYFDQLSKCLRKNPGEESYRMYIQALTLLPHMNIVCGDFAGARENMTTLENEIKIFNGKLRIGQESYIDLQKFLIEFAEGDLSSALSTVNKILQRGCNEISAENCAAAKIIFLILHFELGNFDLLEYLLKSTNNYLKANGLLHRTESAVINFLRAAIKKAPSREEFSRFADQLLILKTDRFELPAFETFDYHCWVESKIYGRTYAGLIREKYLSEKEILIAV